MKEKRSIVVSLGGHKGGIGKTSFSNLLALYLKYKTDYSFVVIDADDKQNSIYSRRKFELKKDENLKEDELYELRVYPSSSVGSKIVKNEMGLYDFIIVDFPGNLNDDGIKKAYNLVDILFIPINPISFLEVQSIMKFCNTLVKEVDPLREKNGFNLADKYFIFNRISRSIKEFKTSENVQQLRSETPFPVLNGYLPRWKYFESDFQTLDYFELPDEKKQNHVESLVGEMVEKMVEVYQREN